jgi:membrane fusion protein (multidrug efflux system)
VASLSRVAGAGPKPKRGLSFAIVLLLLAAAGGCGGRDRSAAGAAAADSVRVTAADSAHAELTGADSARGAGAGGPGVATADSAAADTAAARRGGLLARLFRRGKADDEKKEDPVPVELAAAEVCDMPAYLETTATLEAEKRADVLAKIDGEILEIRGEEGDRVAEGDLLAVLDGAAQRVALEEAQARLKAIEFDLERARTLLAQQLASEKDVSDLRFRFEEGQAQFKAAQLRVDYTQVRAPFSGQIAERLVDRGQTVRTGTPLFTIVDRQPLLVRVHLPEREAKRIRSGQDVWISPDTDPERRVPGQVLRVSPVVDTRTGTVKVTCQVEGEVRELRPGSFVRVRLQTDLRAGVLAVPKRALVPEGGETFVFAVQADSVVKLPVVPGLTDDARVEVVAGLEPGQQVVTVGQGALKSGAKIRPVSADDDGPGARASATGDSARAAGGSAAVSR